ncbi:MAG: hypothetical protein ACOVP4_03215 [Bacteriovoracaceae bacterium]|jgi:hypothetical protein
MVKYLLFVSLLILSSCATMKPENCNYDYGYAQGVNDAKSELNMYPPVDRDKVCTIDGLELAKKGYREGYTFVLKSKPHQTNITVNSGNFRSRRQCLEAFGKKSCGYNCVSGFGQVRCADNPEKKCLAAFGKIKCGHDCEAKFGDIVCH